MQAQNFRALFRFAGAPAPDARVELMLRDSDGRPWAVTMSAGCERFVGRYPRICGISDAAPLLDYRPL